MLRISAVFLVAILCACHRPQAVPGTQVRMDFSRAGSFFAAPFPSDERRGADGSISLAGFPDRRVDLVQKALALIQRDARGFSSSGGVHFALTAPLDGARLPDPAGSVDAGAGIFLFAADSLERTPAEVTFAADGGPFGAPNLLSLIPVQGFPLRPGATYAAVVLRKALDAAGQKLGVSLSMAQLAAGDRPQGLPAPAADAYLGALRALAKMGIAGADVAGLAVFRTGTPIDQLKAVRDDALARPLPQPITGFGLHETFDGYCVYASTLSMPVYQSGAPPYAASGGGWVFDAHGIPQFQRSEEANLWVTIPRQAMPAGGYPAAVFVRTGGGGDRPLVDRGPQPAAGQPATVPGTGPALHFAQAGWAGVSVDGPLGGLRNPTHADEQFLIFNLTNPEALRDNVRQSALELIVLAHALASFRIDAGGCPGAAADARLDGTRLALMGHSMGATIAPLAAAHEPLYRALILSGAGGSWIENVLYKRKPIEVRPLAELLLGYSPRQLAAGDPVLTLVQWAAEPADPQVYARAILREPPPGVAPRQVLMLQGIVDNYILPRIANALSLPLGLDLAGDEIDEGDPALAGQTPLSSLLPLAGRSRISLPASGNASGATAIVVQHRGDGIEDGHEVVFQTDPPKHQYRCFLTSLLKGTPSVPPPGAADAPCE
jgi:hypothetical protein